MSPRKVEPDPREAVARLQACSPVRDPAPPDQKAFSESEAVLLDLIAQYGQASFTEGRHFDADPEYDAPQDERSSGLWRAILPAVRGVRDPSPPEPTDREIGLRSALNAALVDLRIFRGVDDHFVQALEKLVEQTGVRGAGVVEPQDCGLDRQHGPHRFVRPDGTFAACAGGPLPNDGFPDGPVRGALVALYLQGSHGHDPESLGRCVDKCMAKLAPYLASGVVPSAPSRDHFQREADRYLADRAVWPLGAAERIRPAVEGFAIWLDTLGGLSSAAAPPETP